MSIFLDRNCGDRAPFFLGRGTSNGAGFRGDNGLSRGGHNLITAQFLDFGPHLSDMGINELSAIDCKICEDLENSVLESFPSRSSVRFGVSVAVNGFVPRENDIWLSLSLQLPCGGSADPEVWCEVAFVFGSDNSQVGVEMG